MSILTSLLLLLFSISTYANTYFCHSELEKLPILQGGRIKPLHVHASETMKALTGKNKFDDLSSVQAYCLLSLNSMGLVNNLKLEARVDHVDIMKLLNLGQQQHYVSYELLLQNEESLRNEARLAENKPDSYKNSINRLFSNLMKYKQIKNGEDWLLATKNNNSVTWTPLPFYLTEEKVIAQKALTPSDPFLPVLLRSKTDYDSIFGKKYEIELLYSKAGLASWALIFTIVALACMVLFKNFKFTLFFSSLSLVTQIVLISLRTYISGRAPITNMYETVLFSGFGALLLAMVLGHFKKEKLFVYLGLAYSVCTLLMLNFANGMLSATISPLVPVLRDNFWLSTHVTTVILSYGAFALSWILANTILIKRKFLSINEAEIQNYTEIIYTTLKWGVTLLAAGIILGGVWADYSWGRFWGWDPKETWSLIVLCIYMAILHGRYTTWIKSEQFIFYTAGAFLSVMMAWFGVNYILASGLHSYGFSEGGALFLGSFFAVQIALLIMAKTNKLVAGNN